MRRPNLYVVSAFWYRSVMKLNCASVYSVVVSKPLGMYSACATTYSSFARDHNVRVEHAPCHG